MKPVYYIVGAGGIGCAVGYALRAAGPRVVFIEADRDKVAWGKSNGVRVDLRPPLEADFLAFDDWSPEPAGTVLLCTKCYDNAGVLARLPGSVRLLPIQNGFDPALDAFGHELGGIASFVSECLPGRTHTRITRRGRLHLGFRGPAEQGPSDDLVRLLAASDLFRTTVVPNVLPYKYTKLMYNAAISPLAAAAGLDNGQLLAVPRARRLFFELLAENYSILRTAGIALGKIGPFHPDTVRHILRRTSLATALAWAFYPTLRGSYCSMSSDLPRGRTEIDHYTGHLLALAGDRPCPLNRRIYEVVKQMERGRTAPRLSVLEELDHPSRIYHD